MDINGSLLIIFLIIVFRLWLYTTRKAKEERTKLFDNLSSRIQMLISQRDELAKKILIDGIDPSRISYIAKRSGGVMNFSYSTALHGLIINDPSPEEMEVLGVVDKLCGGRIRRDGNRFQIPGEVTPEDIQRFSRT